MASADDQQSAESQKAPAIEHRVWMTALENRLVQAEPNLNSIRKRLFRQILNDPEDTACDSFLTS